MSGIKDPNIEFETHLKNIKCLSQEDELILKEKIPWLYNLFNDLPTKRPMFNISGDFHHQINFLINSNKLPKFDKFRYNNTPPHPKYYVCYDKESEQSYITEVQSDGSEKFSRWEPISFGKSIERWFPGIKKYTL
jgi:hypothetical protein